MTEIRSSGPREASRRAGIKVWDLPTRLFHWGLVALILSAYATQRFSHDPTLYLHRLNGYAILCLLIFRLIWGLVGSETARFAHFLPTPGRVGAYLRAALAGARPHYRGHNPLGSVMIVLLLLAAAAQAGTGLFTSDDAVAEGPLVKVGSDWLNGRAAFYHARGFWIILGLAALHVLANLTYELVLKDRVVRAMVTGRKPEADFHDGAEGRMAPNARALLCLAAASGLVYAGLRAAGASVLR
ncbi:cytochrome B561 [Methylobacterium sp. 4-46]|uniref:cytochrome b/b6 domain-containing protein n=1 Tax=unclassified Methylobacterium TaxID=2615210 RepID=UPI000165C82E|nr:MULTISPECIES: cytochrome b/b6 domain-containing protein [Methylobacterium]ACA16270.1 cytochrome B561 [Methylobacterium sp. 4-46]WFT81980.1 cytochrome b/b6 domain-containing protein [Methylobacterium nodulans]